MSGDALQPQPRGLPLPSPARASIALPFLFFSCLLFAFLVPDVIWRKPIITEEQRGAWIAHHQEARNSILGQKLIEKLLPAQPTRWSTTTMSWEIGRGVWYSQGAVGLESSSGKEIAVPYKVFFRPGASQPIYCVIGSREIGTLTAALDQAGLHLIKP